MNLELPGVDHPVRILRMRFPILGELRNTQRGLVIGTESCADERRRAQLVGSSHRRRQWVSTLLADGVRLRWETCEPAVA